MRLSTRRPHIPASMLLVLAALFVPAHSFAADTPLTLFELRPHCENSDVSACASFEVRDPLSTQTQLLAPGESLDMDLIIRNPTGKNIRRFRAWIAYDPSQLNGLELTVDPSFPVPTPGEQAFSQRDGYIKVSGSSADGTSDAIVVVARIRLQVLAARGNGTPLTFFDASATPDPETGIFTATGTEEENIADTIEGYLMVRAQNGGSSEASSQASAQSEDADGSSVSSAPASGVFTILQVQNVRVTTQGSTVYLAWEPLQSSELSAYNIYYGTTTGRYIQRRSVERDASSLSIRALPVKQVYYFSVRGVSADGRETEFSNEVAVRVGDPKTSTAPLAGSFIPPASPKTDGTVTGQTGLPSMLFMLLALSAMTGTFLAFRRQFGSSVRSSQLP